MLRSQSIRLAIGIALVSAFSGCSVMQTGSTKNGGGWSISKLWKKEYQVPASMSVIWSPDVLTAPGKAPTRGFGGRIFFYNAKHQAISVEGDLIVHGYLGDPQLRGDNPAADKTFGFTADQLTGHFSPSQLGASYSIWIPWDAADSYQEQLTLIPSFKQANGGLLQGAPATLVLPGRTKEQPQRKFPAETISFQKSSQPTNPGIELPRMKLSQGMKTTTIAVPRDTSIGRVAPKKRVSFELGRAPGQEQLRSPVTPGNSFNAQGAHGFSTTPSGLSGSGFQPSMPASQSLQMQAMPTQSSTGVGVGVGVGMGASTAARTTSTPADASQIQPAVHAENVLDAEPLPASRIRSLPAPRTPFARRPLQVHNSSKVSPASFRK